MLNINTLTWEVAFCHLVIEFGLFLQLLSVINMCIRIRVLANHCYSGN